MVQYEVLCTSVDSANILAVSCTTRYVGIEAVPLHPAVPVPALPDGKRGRASRNDLGTVVLYDGGMTSDGLPESGWVTFGIFEEDGVLIAQVQTMARTNDPIYEIFFRLFVSNEQNKIWRHVLRSLGAYYGVAGEVELTKVLIDPKMQWRRVTNVWQNAGARSMLYALTTPLRWAGRRLRGR